MNEKTKVLLDVYKEQTGQIYAGMGASYAQMYRNMTSPVLFSDDVNLKHGDGVGAANAIDLWFAEGGLFADCCLDSPVMSLLCRPLKSIGMMFPMTPDNNTVISRAALTGDYDLDGARPSTVCEPGPNAGNWGSCTLEYRKGRISMSSRTGELDALIENACRGINRESFYLIGGTRGVPGPMRTFQSDQTNQIFTSALYKELHTISTRMNMDLMKMFWTGDPANSVGTGYVEFRGILDYIVDDYTTAGGKPWVTAHGTEACDSLNSDVKVFDACVGELNADGYNLYQLLEEIEYELVTRAALFGVTVDWALVMPSITARSLYKLLPCEMISGVCGTGVANVALSSNDGFLVEARRQMQREGSIDINGRTYQIIEDDFLPVVETLGPPVAYESDILFLPLRINGQPAIDWVFKDYRDFEAELGALGDLATELRGWTDDGMFHHVLQRELRCFLVDVKAEFGVVPHAGFSSLAGRITGVSSCNAQTHKVPNLIT